MKLSHGIKCKTRQDPRKFGADLGDPGLAVISLAVFHITTLFKQTPNNQQ